MEGSSRTIRSDHLKKQIGEDGKSILDGSDNHFEKTRMDRVQDMGKRLDGVEGGKAERGRKVWEKREKLWSGLLLNGANPQSVMESRQVLVSV